MEIQDTSSTKQFVSAGTKSKASKLRSVTKSVEDDENQKNVTDKADSSQIKDTFTKNSDTDKYNTGIYSKESISKCLESMEEQRSEAFISMIEKMFIAQGNSGQLKISDINENIKKTFTQDDIDASKKSISDGGNYSVDAVATRIMDMATALAGDDPNKIPTLRDAVIKGFGQAAKTLGLKDDDMPDITKSTYTEVMKRFDDWTESYNKKEDDLQDNKPLS